MGRRDGGSGPSRAARRVRALVLLAVALTMALATGGCRRAASPAWTFEPGPAASTLGQGREAPASAAPTVRPFAPVPALPVLGRFTPWDPPVATGWAIPPEERGPVAVPILYYHRVQAPPRGFKGWSRAARERFLLYDVVPAAFEAQLDWLQANGYTTILPRDLADYWDRGVPLPDRPVIITFDDGTHDWTWNVLPALRERDMVAQFYVTLAAVRRGAMSWPELRAIVAAGNGIGAHGDRHVQLARIGPRRTSAPEALARREMERPREVFAAKLGVVPDSVAYVGGGFDAGLQRIVEETGYTTARSIVRGRTQSAPARYRLRVIRVGWRLDVVDPVRGVVRPGVPAFARLIEGGG